MIKLMGLLTRKEGMPVEAFQSYWRERHGPLMARTPGLRRYVQSHAVPELYGGEFHPTYDGVAEAWFDSLEALEEARATPQWRAGGPDAGNFIAGARSLIVREVPIIDALPSPRNRATMVKYLGFLTRKEGMPVAAFQKYWREVHGPLVVQGLPGMRRYVQSQALAETYGTAAAPAYDGVPEAWFDSIETYPPSLSTRPDAPRDSARASSGDAVNFLKAGPVPAMIAREIVIVD